MRDVPTDKNSRRTASDVRRRINQPKTTATPTANRSRHHERHQHRPPHLRGNFRVRTADHLQHQPARQDDPDDPTPQHEQDPDPSPVPTAEQADRRAEQADADEEDREEVDPNPVLEEGGEHRPDLRVRIGRKRSRKGNVWIRMFCMAVVAVSSPPRTMKTQATVVTNEDCARQRTGCGGERRRRERRDLIHPSSSAGRRRAPRRAELRATDRLSRRPSILR